MNKSLTLGSLFDGSGGFPLAATRAGIKPVWASEIEPLPILVTATRFSDMEHLGDVARIDGGAITPVDVVTFGSPCQDLSMAGKRAGLEGARSGLFHQAVRVIREMREATDGKFPRYAVWENVPGAFTSNHGADFHAVLQALTDTANPTQRVVLPGCEKWENAGVVLGEGWSLAWRVMDAQFFGVPQRRRRIFLIADFAGQRAPEILFDPPSLPGNPDPCSKGRQTTPRRPEDAPATPSKGGALSPAFAVRMRAGKPGGGKGPLVQTDLSGTLQAANDQTVFVPALFDNHAQDSRVEGPKQVAPTITASFGTGGNNQPLVLNAYGFNPIHKDENNSGRFGYATEVSKTLDTKGIIPTCNQGGIAVVENAAEDYVVRRLTPTECARLQGFPDNWTEGLAIKNPTPAQVDYWWRVWANWAVVAGLKKTRSRKQVRAWLADPVTDTGLYKLWGNGVALPVVEHILCRLAAAG